jgi:peptidoglycan/LPS O-acetylase OafA/YrhL
MDVPSIVNKRNNSFDFTRFVAATGVIFSHHFPIKGFEEPRLYGISVGAVSVDIFFLMSGYLICQSIRNNPDFFRFLSARILRIVPNLLFVLMLTSLATFAYYANSKNLLEHMRYVAQNIVMLVRGGPYYNVTGVFETRPMHALNGSLWSLPYEVWCYFILFGLITLAGKYQKQALLAAIAICIFLFLLPTLRLFPTSIYTQHLGSLGFWFFVGAALAKYSRPIPLVSSPAMSWFGQGGDPSYGMYIFAWPVQQFCAMLISDFWLSMVLAFIVTTAIGYTTWHGFEHNCIARVIPLSSWIRARVSGLTPPRR